MTHVDVVKNEWLAGYHVVVARVYDADGDPKFDTVDKAWEELLSGFLQRGNGSLDLDSLHNRLHGDYVFATEPHDEADCPFADGVGATVPLRAADQPSAVVR